MGVKIPISHLIPLCADMIGFLEVSLSMIWCGGGSNIIICFGGSDYDDSKESRVRQQNKSLTEPEWAFSTAISIARTSQAWQWEPWTFVPKNCFWGSVLRRWSWKRWKYHGSSKNSGTLFSNNELWWKTPSRCSATMNLLHEPYIHFARFCTMWYNLHRYVEIARRRSFA